MLNRVILVQIEIWDLLFRNDLEIGMGNITRSFAFLDKTVQELKIRFLCGTKKKSPSYSQFHHGNGLHLDKI